MKSSSTATSSGLPAFFRATAFRSIFQSSAEEFWELSSPAIRSELILRCFQSRHPALSRRPCPLFHQTNSSRRSFYFFTAPGL
jgi:hypothetical protein